MTDTQTTKTSLEPIPPLDLKAQWLTIKGEISAAINAVVESQQFILGPQVQALEEEIARYCGTKFAVGVASGTDALLLALHVAGVGPGDEVLLPTFSFIATADSVSLLSAIPVFVDIDPSTFAIDPAQLEAKISPRTRAILPVHLYGHPADMDPINAIAQRHNLKVIEDNAQAIGAKYKARKTGGLGDLGCISFFPSKNLGAYGDGGMIVTNSEAYSKHLRVLRNHGSSQKYFATEQGWNSRLDEIQAAILRVKLRHLDHWGAARRKNASSYSQLLKAIPGVVTPFEAPWAEHVYHQYTIRVANRDRVQSALTEQGIGTTVYYPAPIHLQPVFAKLGYHAGDLPQAEKAAKEGLSLPIYAELTSEQIHRVVAAITAAVR
ncbi:MAG TPA: DegT/DnrJ/EryC1/StrS family aminotransferase [Candidatus Dormibacteraeota bacterium]|nr:DegT/DnrJ/EryC1/StrS family aminotransferase [Candidatus Dormibacteraeota bacterium]